MKMFKKWRKGFTWALVGMLTIGLIAGCGGNASPNEQGGNSNSAGGDKVVNIGYVNWAENVAVTYLWKEILEDKGYTVNATSLEAAPLFVGLSQGDLDVFMDSWLPITHESYWEKYKDNLDDYGVWYEEKARIGMVVPEYVTIDSIEELNANKDKFSGKITGIDPGAGIMKATDTAVDSYELDFEVIQSSEAAMITALDKAYRDKEWIAITGWSPHWKFARYDLKYLEDPKLAYGETEELHTLANKEFTKNHPEVVKMLKSFKMNDQQIGSLEDLINDGMDPQEAAKKWIEDNKDAVDSWLQ